MQKYEHILHANCLRGYKLMLQSNIVLSAEPPLHSSDLLSWLSTGTDSCNAQHQVHHFWHNLPDKYPLSLPSIWDTPCARWYSGILLEMMHKCHQRRHQQSIDRSTITTALPWEHVLNGLGSMLSFLHRCGRGSITASFRPQSFTMTLHNGHERIMNGPFSP